MEKNLWTVGGNEIQGYFISCLARPTENVSARNYLMHRYCRNQVRMFKKSETAQKNR